MAEPQEGTWKVQLLGVAPKAGKQGLGRRVGDPKSQDVPLEVPTTSITGDHSCRPEKALALLLPCLAHLVSQPGGGRSCHLPAAQRRTLRPQRKEAQRGGLNPRVEL